MPSSLQAASERRRQRKRFAWPSSATTGTDREQKRTPHSRWRSTRTCSSRMRSSRWLASTSGFLGIRSGCSMGAGGRRIMSDWWKKENEKEPGNPLSRLPGKCPEVFRDESRFDTSYVTLKCSEVLEL